MEISIIVPAYNEEENIQECIEALIDQDYPKKDYEIVIVDDCSTDKTHDIIKNISENIKETNLFIKYIRKDKNEGRLLAIITGINEATNNLLLLVDSRCIVDRYILKNIKSINYQPIVGNPIIEFKNSISRFYYLVRKKLYYPYFGEEFDPVYLTKDNFDKISKGTGIFFCDKKLYLSSLPREKDKNISDDIKLLWNMVQKKKILKHPDVKVKYIPRNSLKEEIRHTFHRGPKFVDYYLDLKKERFWMFIFSPFFLLLFTVLLFQLNYTYFKYWLSLSVFILISISIWLSENIKDFFNILIMLPIIGIAFELGIIKGLIIKAVVLVQYLVGNYINE